MLTPAQHRAEAERLLSKASHVRSEDDYTPAGPSASVDVASLLVARAQTHAILAANGSPSDVVMAHIHDDHDAAFELSCAACNAEPAVSDDELWELVNQASWRWTDAERSQEWEAYFGFPVHKASTAHLLEFLRVVQYVFPRLVDPRRRLRYALPKHNETGIDYSDLHAAGPSTTVNEAWANVNAYLEQQARALSAYVVDPDVDIEVADEITPTHVLRWSSLRVLYAEYEQQAQDGAS